MPVTPGEYEIRENKDGSFEVYNTTTGKVHSKHTTEKEAKHQKQLLYAVGHGWKPTHDHCAPAGGVPRTLTDVRLVSYGPVADPPHPGRVRVLPSQRAR